MSSATEQEWDAAVPEPMEHGATSTGGRERDGDKPTPSEVSDSLTGWEEVAICEAAGKSLEWLQKNDRELTIMRCLAAVLLAREAGVKVGATFRDAMGMTQKQIESMFTPEPDPDAEPDPDTEAGKGDSSPVSTQTT